MISKLYGDFSQVLTAVPTYLYLAPGRKIIISWWFVSQIYFKHQDAIWNDQPIIVVSKIWPMWLPIIVPIKFAAMSLLWIRFPVLLFSHYVTLDIFLAIVWPCLSLMKKSGDDIISRDAEGLKCEACASDLSIISRIPPLSQMSNAEDNFLPNFSYIPNSVLSHISKWMVQITCSDAYMWKQDKNSNTNYWFPV